jgi:hypothetical protein
MDRNRRVRDNGRMVESVARERKLTKLAEADEHIDTAESLIARQLSLLSELQRDGHPTEGARALLETMRESLRQMHAHRRIIEAQPDD